MWLGRVRGHGAGTKHAAADACHRDGDEATFLQNMEISTFRNKSGRKPIVTISAEF